MKPLLLVLAALLALPALPAASQTQTRSAQLYRCGPEGRDLRDSPCPGGGTAAGAVDFDEPSAADTKAARARHLAESRQATAMARARQASEAEARRQNGRAVSLQSLPSPAPSASGPAVTTVKPPKTVKPKKPQKPKRAADGGR